MALRGPIQALFYVLSLCVSVFLTHSSSHMQTTNLCHLHQNNYREINTAFDHFHSDLIWSRAVKEGAWGETIKSLLNGTDHYCAFSPDITDTSACLSLEALRIHPFHYFYMETKNSILFLSHFYTAWPIFFPGTKKKRQNEAFLCRGQDGDELKVYWLQPYRSVCFPFF